MFWQFLSALYLMDFFSSGEVWFEDEEIAGSISTLLRNLAIGDVGLNVAPSAGRIVPTCFPLRQQPWSWQSASRSSWRLPNHQIARQVRSRLRWDALFGTSHDKPGALIYHLEQTSIRVTGPTYSRWKLLIGHIFRKLLNPSTFVTGTT
jgi:hypothetical protein